MNIIDKTLYHQIHPFKLVTDIICAFAAVYLLWLNELVPGIVVAFVPPLAISFFMIRTMDFERQKQSRLGKYVKQHMGRGADTIRSLGLIAMLAGGWFHFLWVIALGLAVIILSWLNGFVFRRENPAQVSARKARR